MPTRRCSFERWGLLKPDNSSGSTTERSPFGVFITVRPYKPLERTSSWAGKHRERPPAAQPPGTASGRGHAPGLRVCFLPRVLLPGLPGRVRARLWAPLPADRQASSLRVCGFGGKITEVQSFFIGAFIDVLSEKFFQCLINSQYFLRFHLPSSGNALTR